MTIDPMCTHIYRGKDNIRGWHIHFHIYDIYIIEHIYIYAQRHKHREHIYMYTAFATWSWHQLVFETQWALKWLLTAFGIFFCVYLHGWSQDRKETLLEEEYRIFILSHTSCPS